MKKFGVVYVYRNLLPSFFVLSNFQSPRLNRRVSIGPNGNSLDRISVTMQPAHVIISITVSIPLLTSAATIFNDNFADLAVSEPNIFNDHKANPSFDSDLFSNTDPVNTNFEDFPFFSGSVLADSGVNDNAVPPCLSSAFQNPLAADILQARSGKQCTSPVKDSDSDSGVNVNIDPLRDLSAGFGIQWAGSDTKLCPYERYGPRSVPVCDSGIFYDIVEDESR